MDEPTSNMTPFPPFPEDIEREIWETAAEQHADEAFSYRILAKYIKLWIDPIIYKTIIWHIEKRSPPTCNLLLALTTPSLSSHIRHLLFRTGKSATNKTILQALASCPNIVDLAIWTDAITNVSQYCEHLRPKRLSISFETLFNNINEYPGPRLVGFRHPTHPLFTEMTHLELVATCSKWGDWQNLAGLPKLTHLSLTHDSSLEVVDGVLRDCKLLKIVTLVDGHSKASVIEQEKSYQHPDVRVVLLRVEYISDWEGFARGTQSSWSVAEGIVAGRIRQRELDNQPSPSTVITSD